MSVSARPRPLRFTLVALFFLIEAILALGLAAFLLLSAGNGLGLGALFDRLRLSVGLSSLLGLPPLLTAALAGLLFRGLWGQREWARLAAMVAAFLFLLTGLAGVAFLFAFDLVAAGTLAALALLILLAAAGVLALWGAHSEPEAWQEAGLIPPPPAVPPAVAPPPPAAALPPPAAYVERLPTAAPPRPPAAPLVAAPSPAAPPALVPPPPHRLPLAPENEAPTLASQPRPHPVAPAARLIVRQGQQLGRQIELSAHQPVVLGRDPFRVDALLDDPAVSGRHARIQPTPAGFLLEDLGSTNGSFVNDQPVHQHLLTEGDEVRLGATTLLFTAA